MNRAERKSAEGTISQLQFALQKLEKTTVAVKQLWTVERIPMDAKWTDTAVQNTCKKMCKMLWTEFNIPLWASLSSLFNKFAERRKRLQQRIRASKSPTSSAEETTPLKKTTSKTATKRASTLSLSSPTPSTSSSPAPKLGMPVVGPSAIGLRNSKPPQVFARGTVVSTKVTEAFPYFEHDECFESEEAWVVMKVGGAPLSDKGRP